MLKVSYSKFTKKYFPKPTSIYIWRKETPNAVGLGNVNYDKNSVNNLDQKFDAYISHRKDKNKINQQRRLDPDMPLLSKPKDSRPCACNGAIIQDESIQKIEEKLSCMGAPEHCVLCGIPISWKNPQLLSQFISPWSGRLYERGVTNLCDKAYWKVKLEWKKSIDNGLMGRNYKNTQFMLDPNLSTFEYENYLSGTPDGGETRAAWKRPLKFDKAPEILRVNEDKGMKNLRQLADKKLKETETWLDTKDDKAFKAQDETSVRSRNRTTTQMFEKGMVNRLMRSDRSGFAKATQKVMSVAEKKLAKKRDAYVKDKTAEKLEGIDDRRKEGTKGKDAKYFGGKKV